MKDLSGLLWIAFTIALSLGCANSSNPELLSEFVIPRDNAVYLYKISDGGVIYTRLISLEDGRAEMEDRIELPENLKVPEKYESSQVVTQGDTKFLRYRYSLLVEENRVTKRDHWGEEILFQDPLRPFSSKWKTRMLTYSNEQRHEQFAECQIVNRQKEILFEQERETITIDCLYPTDGLTILIKVRFAKGIGKIKTLMQVSDDQSISFSEETVLQSINPIIES